MSIAYEINRLNRNKQKVKEQVNVDKDIISEGREFIRDETVNHYSSGIKSMEMSYKDFIPVHTSTESLIETERGGTIISKTLKGNTSQNGTPTPSSPVPVNNVTGEQIVRVCGKNLLDISNMEIGTKNGITISKDNYENITISGTATSYTAFNIPCNLSGENTYSCNNWGSFTLYMQYNGHGISGGSASTNKTYNGNVDNLVIGIDKNVIINKTIRLQVEKGTSATSYEEYQGKDYEINLGKNLLDETTLRQGSGYDPTITNRVFFPSNYYLEPGTYTCYTNLNTTNYKYAVGIATKAYPNPVSYVHDSGWQTLDHVTFTLSQSGYLGVGVAKSDGTSSITPSDISNYHFMLYKGSYDSTITYAPYFEPIELNKIGDYQDFIRKGTGKNIFDKNNANILNGWLDNNKMALSPTQLNRLFYIPCKANTTYTISRSILTSAFRVATYDSEPFPTIGSSEAQYNISGLIKDNSATSITITTGANAKYLIVHYGRLETDLNIEESLKTIQIEENAQATSFEPYGYKDKWYTEKNVGKVVLNGSENGWSYPSANRFNLDDYVNDYLKKNNDITYVCDSYMGYGQKTSNSDFNTLVANVNYGFDFGSGNAFNIRIKDTRYTSIADFKSSLQTNNVTLYYVLANPTYTLIENEDLIEQLERVHLEQGLNNISVVTNNEQPVLKMSYVSNLIGIDEEQLKDINVNFGEKYGPINSVVIARAADSDFVFKEDEQSIAEDGLCEVKISDNQILNGDNRTQFLDGIYYQLKGTEFYLNDFSSTGIVYLDLLDYYKVKVFDNSYKCLMLNDEIDITQGLQEQVFTERPKESETEYKSIAKQDKDIRKIGIIVNKVKGEITAEIEARKGTDAEVSRISQTSSEINERLETTETTLYDSENGLVNKVTTHSLDIKKTADGLEIEVGRVDVLKDDVKVLDDNTKDIRDNFLFNEDGLTIRNKGSDTEDMKLNLTNEAIKFLYQNNAVLTINGSMIEFSNASFKKLDLGNYVWQAEDDDSLSLIYEGGNN